MKEFSNYLEKTGRTEKAKQMLAKAGKMSQHAEFIRWRKKLGRFRMVTKHNPHSARAWEQYGKKLREFAGYLEENGQEENVAHYEGLAQEALQHSKSLRNKT